MIRSKTGFVWPENDAVVFFSAENSVKMLNTKHYKELSQWPLVIYLKLCFDNGFSH